MIKSAPIKILSLAAVVLGSLLFISFSKEKLIPQKIEDKIVANINGSLDSTLIVSKIKGDLKRNQAEYAWKLFAEIFKPSSESKSQPNYRYSDWMNSLSPFKMKDPIFQTDLKIENSLDVKNNIFNKLEFGNNNTFELLKNIQNDVNNENIMESSSKSHPKTVKCNVLVNEEIVMTEISEITYINKPLFDYLNSKHIYDENVNDIQNLNAPNSSKEFKISLVKKSDAYYSKYWNQLLKFNYKFEKDNGFLEEEFGVIAVHIITKDLKNWFWTTFEFSNNEILLNIDNSTCSSYKSEDTYGKNGNVISYDLQNIFKTNNMDINIFGNYILRGTQTKFRDALRPIKLGNTIIENGGMSNSSCISCHSYARVDKIGEKFGINFTNGLLPKKYNIGDNGTSTFNNSKNKASADFMWSVGFRMNQINKKK